MLPVKRKIWKILNWIFLEQRQENFEESFRLVCDLISNFVELIMKWEKLCNAQIYSICEFHGNVFVTLREIWLKIFNFLRLRVWMWDEKIFSRRGNSERVLKNLKKFFNLIKIVFKYKTKLNFFITFLKHFCKCPHLEIFPNYKRHHRIHSN